MTERSNRNLYTKISQLVLAGYWIALFVATHLPPTTPFLPGPAIDKLVHALVYAVLAGLLATAWELAAGALILFLPRLRTENTELRLALAWVP